MRQVQQVLLQEMDVTFTNVLEGARQYFQGLPAASESATVGPAAVRPAGSYGAHRTDVEAHIPTTYLPNSNAQMENKDVSQHVQYNHQPNYWLSQDVDDTSKDPGTAKTHERLQELSNIDISNASSQQEQMLPCRTTQNSLPTRSEDSTKIMQYHYQPQPTSQSYQYSSRIPENTANSVVHYPNTYAHVQNHQQNIHTIQHQQQRPTARTQEAPKMQQCYQLQTPKQHINTSHAENIYMNGYTQSSSYYPPHSKPQSPAAPPPTSQGNNYIQTASNQTLNQFTQSYSHSQSPVQSQTQYLAVKPAQNDTYDDKGELGGMHMMHMTNRRATHNLPPIASLSSVNYHSNKGNRETVQRIGAIQRHRTQTQPQQQTQTQNYISGISVPNNTATTVPSSAYEQTRPLYTQQNQNRTNSYPVQNTSNTQVQYPGNNYQFPTVSTPAYTCTSVNTSSSSSKQLIYPQSSYPQYFQKTNKVPEDNTNQKIHQPTRLPEQNVIQQRTVIPKVLSEVINPKQKRESPLDLSVKTVRTTADSTALDDSEAHCSERYAKSFKGRVDSKNIYQNASNGTYPAKNHHGISQQRNVIRSTNVQGAGAPKVDFLPNFAASTLHPTQDTQPTFQQFNKISEANVNQNKITRNVTHENYYRQNYQQVPTSSYQNRPNCTYLSQTNDNKQLEPTLPRFEFPIEGNGYKKQPNNNNFVPNIPARKRSTDSPATVPNKITKIDSWRQTIDQQIEQRLSSYANSRLQQEQHYKQVPNQTQFVKPAVSNSSFNTNQNKIVYAGNQPYYHQQNSQTYRNQFENQVSNHNHTYVPEVNQQLYSPNNQNQMQYDMYVQNSLQRSNSASKLLGSIPVKSNNIGGAADKRILSILRNSLEIKGAKEAQKKLEQSKPSIQSGVQHPSTDVTAPLQPKPSIHGRHNVSPFTASSLLERNSNTPPSYKFHFPRAVDSVKFESDTVIKDELLQRDGIHTYPTENANSANCNIPMGASTGTTDLDGLAAFLAARIRTKAELKQVPSQEQTQNKPEQTLIENKTTPSVLVNVSGTSSSGGSPPKLPRELNTILAPRRKLFSKSEDDQQITIPCSIPNGNVSLPLRNTTLRSSSETSVFDFRDSDSEGEMPVLERQSLEDMRRDRKSHNKNIQPIIIPDEINIVEDVPIDTDWGDVCDKFVEQLTNNVGKKRGRRKKVVEPDVLAKLESVTKENPLPEINLDVVKKEVEDIEIKKEIIDPVEIKQEPIEELTAIKLNEELITLKLDMDEELNLIKLNADSDSDVPLNIIKRPIKKEENFSEDEEVSLLSKKSEKIGAKTRIEYSSDSDSDNIISEKIDSVSRKLFTKKTKRSEKIDKLQKGMVLRSADSSPVKKSGTFLKKKAIFGDGSDFHPGWEEEVYKYKRSIRMPARLISVTRPHWHRMSTSLPDLDACSPAPSFLTDDTEFTITQRKSLNSSIEAVNLGKLKRDILDSDIDSNSSFSFSNQKVAYDSEEASCSSTKISSKKSDSVLKTKENNNSILDVLVERYGKQKKKKIKVKDKKNGPKIIQKSSNLLLATPSLGIGSPEGKEKKKGRPKKEKDESIELNNSVYLGFFRKETVNTFRDTFKKNSNGFMGMGEPFSTVVLKSRTRTETRVLKQRATIREVFGEDRPASAPPMTCHEDDESNLSSLQIEKSPTEKTRTLNLTKNKENKANSIRAGLRSATTPNKKLYLVKKRKNLLKKINLEKLKVKNENAENVNSNVIKTELNDEIKSETPSINGDETSDASNLPTKKRLKLTKMRRKFSSGFDYIRKKKKIIKKDGSDVESLKPKRRCFIPKQNPESEQDIQKEIKTWVMNKGVGETHLHRAARLGYTDVTAYCLEKMDCAPSPRDNAGYTPLHEACSRGHLDIARLLLLYGANVSESAQGGIRPLHEAAENGFVEIIRLLLSYGADPMLATYSGLTPLSLASDEETKYILKNYIADMEGLTSPPWIFKGPAKFFDCETSGYNALEQAPSPDPESDKEDMEFEISETLLPNLYSLRDEPPNDRWILLQDLSNLLKIKSRDTLLRQISPIPASSSATTNVNKSLIKEMKFNEFMERAHCCTLLCANEKVNVRSSKIALVQYTDKVKKLLGVEKFVVPAR